MTPDVRNGRIQLSHIDTEELAQIATGINQGKKSNSLPCTITVTYCAVCVESRKQALSRNMENARGYHEEHVARNKGPEGNRILWSKEPTNREDVFTPLLHSEFWNGQLHEAVPSSLCSQHPAPPNQNRLPPCLFMKACLVGSVVSPMRGPATHRVLAGSYRGARDLGTPV
ncbi:hypothetical protein B0H10DRAFT_1947419 [Mycena sp. CBHHK59/15]|nr:hypothetical protein B0H10DRAFT_1947419 [Mycena sp. CBHHK59/15]